MNARETMQVIHLTAEEMGELDRRAGRMRHISEALDEVMNRLAAAADATGAVAAHFPRGETNEKEASRGTDGIRRGG